MRLVLLLLIILLASCTDQQTLKENNNAREEIVDKEKLIGMDFRLYQNTPAWDLAKAVWDNDTNRINSIVSQKKVDIDYRESRFGQTLLMLATENELYDACKKLLELGADPNKYDAYDGSSSMIEAANVIGIKGDNTRFLKLLLQYKGNPNFVEVGKRREGNSTRNSVLIAAIDRNQMQPSLFKVKMLVEAGADINYKNEFGQDALSQAAIQEVYDVVLYLLQKGADYNEILLERIDTQKIQLMDLLREYTPPLDSRDYKQKMAVVDFLKQKGLDYKKAPIPGYTIKEIKRLYPNSWKEYLEKY
jgi:uncharacterized protein